MKSGLIKSREIKSNQHCSRQRS